MTKSVTTAMVFEQADLGTITLKNRIIRSATHEGLAVEQAIHRRTKYCEEI